MIVLVVKAGHAHVMPLSFLGEKCGDEDFFLIND
jgi:hypothetical protein